MYMTLKVLYGYASIFFVKKKNESLFPVQNYRNLNLLMIKNKYIPIDLWAHYETLR